MHLLPNRQILRTNGIVRLIRVGVLLFLKRCLQL